MQDQIDLIKTWLGKGSVNIFGLPMSGKDTLGQRLAANLDAVFLSSGAIFREYQKLGTKISSMDTGHLAPTEQFIEIILPFFKRKELENSPLVLSSIGRWHGEEQHVIDALEDSYHPLKAVLLLNLSESDVHNRYETSRALHDRADRVDDRNLTIFETRLAEFRQKTLPVVEFYRKRGLLIPINADQTRDQVFTETISRLADFAKKNAD